MRPKKKNTPVPHADPPVPAAEESETLAGGALNVLTIPAALIAVVLEFLSTKSLLSPAPSTVTVLGFHFLALLAAVPALRLLFPEQYRRLGWTFAALVIGFALPLPVIGPAFLLGYRLLLLMKPARNVESKYVLGTTQYLTLPRHELDVHEEPRSVAEILNGKDDVVRRAAILALRIVEPKKALPLLQKAIQDSDEQVRLLAQTQFNQIIAGLEGRVKTLEADLATPPRHLNKLLLLAEQYHEMVYLGLATDETQAIYLGRAIELLDEAASTAPDNTAVRFLLVKCSLKAGRLDQARAGIQFLRKKGWQPEVLVPWEVEIAFLERDWELLSTTLKKLDVSGATPAVLRGPMEFWLAPAKG
ncbi:MAG: tetratricopeptide repeat protein [Verrucomicrobia bacterium]|nr:tetratricopeptide repeat protein [Verrucomicrobiota bacterium]